MLRNRCQLKLNCRGVSRHPNTRARYRAPARPQRRRSVALKLVSVIDSVEAVAPPSVDKEAPGLDFATRFGHNLSRCRERAGLSQEELGMRAELHRTAVGQLERGQRIARADTLVKLAGSLAVRPEDLLAGLEWEPSIRTEGRLTISADADA
jgi:DNA-binding XRE family transcriptional regulator